MKSLFYLAIATSVLLSSAVAQTKVIAYKRNGGDMANFVYEGADHLGLVEEVVSTLDSLILLEDSSVVVIRTEKIKINGHNSHSVQSIDTVLDFPPFRYPRLTYQEMKAQFPQKTVFIGFDRKEMNRRAKEKSHIQVSQDPILPIEPVDIEPIDSTLQPTLSQPQVDTASMIPPAPPQIQPSAPSQSKPKQPQQQEKPRQEQGSGFVIAIIVFFLFIYTLFRATLKPVQDES